MLNPPPPYNFTSRAELKEAVVKWDRSRVEAIATYGNIEEWNTRGVTDMVCLSDLTMGLPSRHAERRGVSAVERTTFSAARATHSTRTLGTGIPRT